MRYHIMPMKHQDRDDVIQVMDFKKGVIIRFSLDELEKDELPEELKKLIKSNIRKINDGRWDYKILK